MSRYASYTAGCSLRNAAVNQRRGTESTTASMPCARHCFGPLVPVLGRPELRRGAQQHEPIDALRRVCRQPHPDHAAEREPDVRHPADRRSVEQRQHARAEVGDRARRGFGRRAAVPGQVEADDAEMLGQRGDLRLPHLGRRAKRRPENKRGRRRRAVENGVQAHAQAHSCASNARSMKSDADPSQFRGSKTSSTSAASEHAANLFIGARPPRERSRRAAARRQGTAGQRRFEPSCPSNGRNRCTNASAMMSPPLGLDVGAHARGVDVTDRRATEKPDRQRRPPAKSSRAATPTRRAMHRRLARSREPPLDATWRRGRASARRRRGSARSAPGSALFGIADDPPRLLAALAQLADLAARPSRRRRWRPSPRPDRSPQQRQRSRAPAAGRCATAAPARTTRGRARAPTPPPGPPSRIRPAFRRRHQAGRRPVGESRRPGGDRRRRAPTARSPP